MTSPIETLASGAAREAVSTKSQSPAWFGLTALSISMLLASLNTSIANAGLPALSQAFAASFSQAQWVTLAYLLAITTMIVAAGRLGDMIGRKRLLLVGLLGFTVASFVCGFAPSLAILTAGRAIQGLGAAIMMSLSIAFVTESTSQNKTGSALGLLGAMSAAGTALGPSLGGLLIAGLGWRAIFFVSVPMGFIALYFAFRSLSSDGPIHGKEQPKFDSLGMTLLALSLGAYSLSMTLGKGSFNWINGALAGLALAAAAVFVLAQKKSASPLIQADLLRDPKLQASLAASALVSTVMMSTLVVGPFYLARSIGLDEMQRGLVLSLGPLSAALAGVPAGRFADRFGASRISTIGLGAMVIGSLLLALSNPSLGLPCYILPIIVLTGGYALFQTANNTSVMSSISPNQRGVASGVLNLSRNLGLITGAAAMGALFALASGMSGSTAVDSLAVAHGMKVTYSVSAACIAIALALGVWAARFTESTRSQAR